jgi:hypothetical protein
MVPDFKYFHFILNTCKSTLWHYTTSVWPLHNVNPSTQRTCVRSHSKRNAWNTSSRLCLEMINSSNIWTHMGTNNQYSHQAFSHTVHYQLASSLLLSFLCEVGWWKQFQTHNQHTTRQIKNHHWFSATQSLGLMLLWKVGNAISVTISIIGYSDKALVQFHNYTPPRVNILHIHG